MGAAGCVDSPSTLQSFWGRGESPGLHSRRRGAACLGLGPRVAGKSPPRGAPMGPGKGLGGSPPHRDTAPSWKTCAILRRITLPPLDLPEGSVAHVEREHHPGRRRRLTKRPNSKSTAMEAPDRACGHRLGSVPRAQLTFSQVDRAPGSETGASDENNHKLRVMLGAETHCCSPGGQASETQYFISP